jgi:hypothetical protein
MAGTLTISTLSDGTNSTSATNPIKGSAKAWVNFNGSSGASPVIRASYNVSLVTRTTTGTYTVDFTNAFADANFACVVGGQGSSTFPSAVVGFTSYSYTTSSVQIVCDFNNGNLRDATICGVAIFD